MRDCELCLNVLYIHIFRKLRLLVNYGMCGNYHSKEASVLLKHCDGMHINCDCPQAQVSLIAAYSLKTTIVLLGRVALVA